MTIPTRCRRSMRVALAGGPLLIAVALAGSGAAHADQASYLDDLHRAGIHDQGGDPDLLSTGTKLCNEVWYGESPTQLAAMALQSSDTTPGHKGITAEQASDLVNFAVKDLCPNY